MLLFFQISGTLISKARIILYLASKPARLTLQDRYRFSTFQRIIKCIDGDVKIYPHQVSLLVREGGGQHTWPDAAPANAAFLFCPLDVFHSRKNGVLFCQERLGYLIHAVLSMLLSKNFSFFLKKKLRAPVTSC